jgi:hypothetical protein
VGTDTLAQTQNFRGVSREFDSLLIYSNALDLCSIGNPERQRVDCSELTVALRVSFEVALFS